MFPSIGRIVPEVSGPNFLENVRNSPDISKGIFKAGMCKFESSQVRQALKRSAGFLKKKGRKSRLFAYSISSPDSQFTDLNGEIPESLRPCPRIFPFCGD
jgi:hypothetical protein